MARWKRASYKWKRACLKWKRDSLKWIRVRYLDSRQKASWKWKRASLKLIRARCLNNRQEEGLERTGSTSKVNLKVKEYHSKQATLGATTWDVLVIGSGTVEPDTHLAVTKIGDEKAEGASWDIEVSQDGHNDVVIYPVKCLAEVHQASKYSSGFLVTIVQVSVDKVKHLNQIVVDRATREASKLVKINVRGDIRPYPLDQEPL